MNINGGTKITFSASTSWGPVNYGIAVGHVTKNNVGGLIIDAPNKVNYFHAKVDRDYRYRRVLVDQYKQNIYQRSYWTTWVDLYRQRGYAVKAS